MTRTKASHPPPREHPGLSERPASAFLPTDLDEARARGWEELDVVLVTGDAYVDHPAFGAAVIGRVLEAQGYRVGVLSQPDWKSAEPFRSFGRPRLFFGVTAGAMDSMVNHYTAHKRRRSDDAYSPDGRAGLRPDRAATVYAQRCREAFKDVPVILGGVEASLRRLAHYDFWDDALRRSVLFDSKADLVVYGQGEQPIVEVAQRLARGEDPRGLGEVRGIAFIPRDRGALPKDAVTLPSFEEIGASRETYALFSRLYHREQNPLNARPLVQPHGDRAVVVNPPALPPTTEELDRVWALPYARAPHPKYRGAHLPAWEQIRGSIQLMRGCSGGCAFCCIAEHQGREVSSRSKESVLAEVRALAQSPDFRGTLTDLGGPTANLWRTGCSDPHAQALCRRASCLSPFICKKLHVDHAPLIELYREVRKVPGVRHVFVGSGVRYDVAQSDAGSGEEYLRELVSHHVSGQLKVAPEHVAANVLKVMRKPPREAFDRFRQQFERFSREAGKEQYLVPYFISSHPGCSLEDAAELHDYLRANRWHPQQVQDFMPTPMTLATDMFYSGLDPLTMKPLPVARSVDDKKLQKALMRWADPELAPWYGRAMQKLGRTEVAKTAAGNSRARGKTRRR